MPGHAGNHCREGSVSAKIQHGQVVGRMGMTVPGPMTETLPSRQWFPA
ncbi:MAG: hypothetical protein AAFW01_19565 [Pseudomonadota bacterium]